MKYPPPDGHECVVCGECSPDVKFSSVKPKEVRYFRHQCNACYNKNRGMNDGPIKADEEHKCVYCGKGSDEVNFTSFMVRGTRYFRHGCNSCRYRGLTEKLVKLPCKSKREIISDEIARYFKEKECGIDGPI